MPFYSLTVTLDGEEALQKKLAATQMAITDWRPLWPEVIGWFRQMEVQQFATEGGGSWAPLAPSTVRRRGSAHPILNVTAALRNSLTAGARGGFVIQTPVVLTIGTDLRVGRWSLGLLHQRGTRRMPARRPIHLTRPQQSAAIRIFQQHIHRVIAARYR